MTVASCPSCKESVTVPVDATPESVVRCPLCHEEFTLEAFLDQLPPKLIVLDAGTSDTTADAASTTVEPDTSSSNVLGAFMTGDSAESSAAEADSVPAFEFTPGSAETEDEEPATTAPRRRAQKNPTIEVLKIVAGALLAIPLAQIVLWWLVPSGWQRDLFRMGPSVSRVVPWVVPEKFRATEIPTEDDAPPSVQRRSANANSGRKQARTRPSNGSAMPAPGSAHKNTTPPDVAKKGTEPEVDMQPDPAAKTETNTVDEESYEDPPPPEDEPTTEVLVRGVRGAPEFTPSQFRNILEAALQASIAWDAAIDRSQEERAKLDAQFYSAFAQLSEAVTYPPPDDPRTGELVAGLSDVLQTFTRKPEKLAMIGNQGTAWLERSSRPSQGLFIFGTVKQIGASGELFTTKMELASLQEQSVTVVSRVDPRVTFKSGDRILMLGAIVEQPSKNLLGYGGKEPMVVMGGFPVLLQ